MGHEEREYRVQSVTVCSDATKDGRGRDMEFYASHIKAQGFVRRNSDGSISFEALLASPVGGSLGEVVRNTLKRQLCHYGNLEPADKSRKLAVLKGKAAQVGYTAYEHWNPDRLSFQFMRFNPRTGKTVLYRIHASLTLKKEGAVHPARAAVSAA